MHDDTPMQTLGALDAKSRYVLLSRVIQCTNLASKHYRRDVKRAAKRLLLSYTPSLIRMLKAQPSLFRTNMLVRYLQTAATLELFPLARLDNNDSPESHQARRWCVSDHDCNAVLDVFTHRLLNRKNDPKKGIPLALVGDIISVLALVKSNSRTSASKTQLELSQAVVSDVTARILDDKDLTDFRPSDYATILNSLAQLSYKATELFDICDKLVSLHLDAVPSDFKSSELGSILEAFAMTRRPSHALFPSAAIVVSQRCVVAL